MILELSLKVKSFNLGKQFQTRKLENPSKTIVFTMYFQGRALKYYVKIN